MNVGKLISLLYIILLFLSLPLLSKERESLTLIPYSSNDIAVDGILDDWADSSFQILYNDDVTKKKAEIATKYNDDGLYIALKVYDISPLENECDKLTASSLFWQGDSTWVHIYNLNATDSEKLVTNLIFLHSSKTDVDIGVFDNIDYDKPSDVNKASFALNPKDGYAGYGILPDNQGYIQEIFISKKQVLRGKQEWKEGIQFRLGLNLFWGIDKNLGAQHSLNIFPNTTCPDKDFFSKNKNAWGLFELKTKNIHQLQNQIESDNEIVKTWVGKYRTDGEVAIKYNLPFNAHVSLVITDKFGNIVRHLISDYPRGKGNNVDYWDLKDDYGVKLQKDKYYFKGLYFKKIDAAYQFPINCSIGQGYWLMTGGIPWDIVSMNSKVFVSTNSWQNGLMCFDDNEKILWRVNSLPGGLLTLADNLLYLLTVNKDKSSLKITRINPDSGAPVLAPDGKFEYKLLNGHINRIPRKGTHKKIVMGFSYAYNLFWVSLYFENKLVAINPKTMQPIKLFNEYKVKGLTTHNGVLYAIINDKVVKINSDFTFVDVIETSLSDPVALTIDKKGNFYVTDWGNEMNVKVFDKNGLHTNTIAESGGRGKESKYNQYKLDYPQGIAIINNEKVWVTEDSRNPKRVSIWNKKGDFLDEFFALERVKGLKNFVDVKSPNNAFSSLWNIKLNWQFGFPKLYQKYSNENYRLFDPNDFDKESYFITFSEKNINYENLNTNNSWSYPISSHSPNYYRQNSVALTAKGRVFSPNKVVGTVKTRIGKVFCISDKNGQAYLITNDGTFITQLFKDYRDSMSMINALSDFGRDVSHLTCGKNWKPGQFFRNNIDNNIYLTINSESLDVIRLFNLDKIYRIDKQEIIIENKLKQSNKTQSIVKQNILLAPKVKHPAQFSDVIDQFSLDEDNMAIWGIDEAHYARATFAYDSNFIYCLIKVSDETPLINKAKENNFLISKGDAIVLDIRKNYSTSEKNINGDSKLVFVKNQDGKHTILIEYSSGQINKPVIFTSKKGSIKVSGFSEVIDIKTKYEKLTNGYMFYAKIPAKYFSNKSLSFKDKFSLNINIIYSGKNDNIGVINWNDQQDFKHNDIIDLLKFNPNGFGKLILE